MTHPDKEMPARPCIVCKIRPAAIPDRERMGRPINRVCRECHADRLRGDLRQALEIHDKKIAAAEPPHKTGETNEQD